MIDWLIINIIIVIIIIIQIILWPAFLTLMIQLREKNDTIFHQKHCSHWSPTQIHYHQFSRGTVLLFYFLAKEKNTEWAFPHPEVSKANFKKSSLVHGIRILKAAGISTGDVMPVYKFFFLTSEGQMSGKERHPLQVTLYTWPFCRFPSFVVRFPHIRVLGTAAHSQLLFMYKNFHHLLLIISLLITERKQDCSQAACTIACTIKE